MRNEPDRLIFTVTRHEGRWVVEQGDEQLDAFTTKEEAQAAANKRARAAQDGGQPCLVRVSGEHGFFASA